MERSRRLGLALAVVLGLVLSVLGTPPGIAKPKACKKGFVRQKSRCVRKKAATTKGTIKIGVLAAEVNSRGQVVPPEAKQISRVWVDAINAAGGLNGFKI